MGTGKPQRALTRAAYFPGKWVTQNHLDSPCDCLPSMRFTGTCRWGQSAPMPLPPPPVDTRGCRSWLVGSQGTGYRLHPVDHMLNTRVPFVNVLCLF